MVSRKFHRPLNRLRLSTKVLTLNSFRVAHPIKKQIGNELSNIRWNVIPQTNIPSTNIVFYISTDIIGS
jgi:hypothetical protein